MREWTKHSAEEVGRYLLQHISSQDYLDKLIIECDGNVEMAKSLQKDRVMYLTTAGFVFVRDPGSSYVLPSIFYKLDIELPIWLKHGMAFIQKRDVSDAALCGCGAGVFVTGTISL